MLLFYLLGIFWEIVQSPSNRPSTQGSGCNVLEAFEAFEFLEALEACFSITPFAEEAAESSPLGGGWGFSG
jgi:hypothetical protein